MQYVSLDSFEEQAEYIRHGLDFNLLWDRVNQFLTEIPGRNSITFIVTMNNLSVTGLPHLNSLTLPATLHQIKILQMDDCGITVVWMMLIS
jgi:hypothetical protein